MAGLEPARAFMAQRILSPLRLPFRHIGAVGHEFKRFMQPAKMNFVIGDPHGSNGKRFVARSRGETDCVSGT